MNRLDFTITDRQKRDRKVPRKAIDGSYLRDDAGNVLTDTVQDIVRFKGHVLVFEDRIRIVRDGADENSTGIEVWAKDGYLDAQDFDGPIGSDAPTTPAPEEPTAPPAADEQPVTPPPAVEATAAATED
jgi:hypothetical protein